ncbi:MAG: nucleoside 2-deoxyribosyltransferase [Candidatus Acidiferrum sp.]|jgi:nucleoside 2-deoxyribosyltransferase
MAKHFYLATRKDRGNEADALSAELQAHGWQRTYAWTALDSTTTEGFAEVALKEIAGVRDADVLIVLLPGGFGTHVEIGAALALGKPVILHAPDARTLETPYRCVFHHHPGVRMLISENIDIATVLACLPQPVTD